MIICRQRVLTQLLVLGPLLLSPIACGSDDEDDEEEKKAVPYAGMAIASIAADYSSSTLYYQGLKEGMPLGDLKTVLTGESGIPWPVTLDDKLYFFNRSAQSSNFRTLDPKAADIAATAQVRTELAGIGDPHDAVLLDKTRLLLAHYTAGKIIVVNPETGAVLQEISAEWDLGADATAKLMPEAIYRTSIDQVNEVYILHQGRKADFSGYNGSQQLFVLKDDGTSLSVVDVDPATAKVQGIKLNVFNPQIVYGGVDAAKPYVFGLCTIFDTASPCTSGIERVDLKGRTSAMVQDLSQNSEKGNGGVVVTPKGQFFAAAASAGEGGNFKSFIWMLDPEGGKAERFYEINDSNYAAYAMGVDAAAGRLYIGEKNTDNGTGKITILNVEKQGEVPFNIDLPLPPAEIEFVP